MKREQNSFTLIELLVSIAIIGILAAMAIASFSIYKKDAHYARAVSDLTNARKAAEVGLIDFPDGVNIGLTWTGTQGGNLPGQLSGVMPGFISSEDVQLGFMFNACGGAQDWGMQYWMMSQACKGEERVVYMKFCNGIDVMMPHMMGVFCGN